MFFFCFWCWINKKSRNSSSLIIQENNDKKVGLINYSKKVKAVVVRSATKFPCGLFLWITELPFTCHCQNKTNPNFFYAVYCARPSSIIKYMSYVHLFYITSTYNIYIWLLLLYYKMTKTGNKFKKTKRIFCFTHCKYPAYLLNVYLQPYIYKPLTNGTNVCGAIFCYDVTNKVHTLK